MAKNGTNKSTTKGGSKTGLAMLAAGAAAAAAGYYFYASKNAPQHRKKAAKWAGDLKRDVVREAKKLPKLDKATLAKAVDAATAAYATARSIDKRDLLQAANELKRNWTRVVDEARGAVNGARAGAAKAAKKSAPKKAAKKRSAKKSQ